MTQSQGEFIDVSRLRVGHYVFMDQGWMSHPFALNSFRIQSEEQIETIRSLGIDRIRYSPQRSDPVIVEPPAWPAAAMAGGPGAGGTGQTPGQRRALLARQQASLQKCERLFSDASRVSRQVCELASSQPEAARQAAQALIEAMNGKLNGEGESCIRLLSEKAGERASLHAINVTIISLLLGKALGLDDAAMADIGMGALVHDIGMAELPERLCYDGAHLTAAERRSYQEHVRHGVAMGRKMNLAKGALLVIGQHHECADGSGYPQQVRNDLMSAASRVVALVDRYDELCNPSNPAHALTPYEAMSSLFAQHKACFDGATLNSFVRMMGVYPPGSVVQLSDGRYALVVSVNPARPLKPWVIIHDGAVPREEALVVDLSREPALGIRRSLRPLQLPKATYDYLSPRQRVCYFFEHARSLGEEEGLP